MQEEHLADRADRLQREAHAVLDDLGLLTFLAPIGHPRIVGSVALGLMTWPDIDIDVEVAGEIRDDEVWQTARFLLDQEAVTLVSLADDRSGATENRPPSMYVGARFRAAEDTIWKIDIRFVRASDAIASAHLEELHAKLMPRSRQWILEIKDFVCERPEYGRAVSGIDVYRAVLFDGVEDLAGFDTWLRQRDMAADTRQPRETQ